MRLSLSMTLLVYLVIMTSMTKGGKNFVAQKIHDPKDQDNDESGTQMDSSSDENDGKSSSDESEGTDDTSGNGEENDEQSIDSKGDRDKSPKSDRQNVEAGKLNAKEGGHDVQAVVEAYKEFSKNVYQAMVQAVGPDKNMFCSILSLSMALAMVREGAKGQTRQEMDSVLGLPENGTLEGYHAAMEKFTSNEFYMIEAANKLYIGNDFQINPDYKTRVIENFMAEAENIDFTQNEQAKNTINGWVEDKTHGKIENLFESIDPSAVLALVNAIYFRADWRVRFNESDTIIHDFLLETGPIEVDTMYIRSPGTFYSYYWPLGKADVLQMHYKGNKTAMYIFLNHLTSKEDGFGLNVSKIEKELYRFDYSVFPNKFRTDPVHYMSLPKFKLETTHKGLVQVLSDAGMASLFDDNADLTGISDARMFVSQVVQKAFVEVNENGTEAAGGTGIVTNLLSVPTPENDFYVKRPFVFVIRCETTGLILFQGRVMDPRYQ